MLSALSKHISGISFVFASMLLNPSSVEAWESYASANGGSEIVRELIGSDPSLSTRLRLPDDPAESMGLVSYSDDPVEPTEFDSPFSIASPEITSDLLPSADIHPPEMPPFFRTRRDPPLGFSGPSSVLPSENQNTSHFVPIEDRWRIGFPSWDRYAKGHPPGDDYPGVQGTFYDPYNQNVLKGDYPLIGQNTFLKISLKQTNIMELRQVPTPTTPFEATQNPGQNEFFGDPNQFFFTQYNSGAIDLFHGDASFKPVDWRVRINSIYNVNFLRANELAVVTPDVRDGLSRLRQDFALEEWFYETKLADLSPNYDFLSIRAGSQPFTSDFRGFIFSDINRGVRLFGNRLNNQDQYNVVWFDQTEKETNSLLNTFDDRHQNTLIANYYRQDLFFPGYNSEVSFHYNNDQASTQFDTNGFLVRPDPVGVYAEHAVKSYYLGVAGNGHINRFNISHAAYYVFGDDELNPLAGQSQRIDAYMGALEISYDRDWARFRVSYFFSSGDSNPNDGRATGFDTILDNPNFAGGEFSYWNRQQIRLFGVNLVNRLSLVPNLRSSKFQGQTNFVNPGLQLVNFGFDSDLTPKTKLITNANYLWFNQTEVLETYVFQDNINNEIGLDLSGGFEYRPFLNNNVMLTAGVSGLIVGQGFKDLYQPFNGSVSNLAAGFAEASFEY
ncbi:MAG: hypothetical protein NTW52_15555 [Planctomycetota bacterium]|nr:hypothetical protein [Planctomycetota bacterium]